jgi:hypothetical protein
LRIVELSFLVVVIGQVQHNCSGLEDAKIAIFEGRDATIRIDVEEPLLLRDVNARLWLEQLSKDVVNSYLLSVLGDVDLLNLVLQAKFLKHDGWLESIGSSEGVVAIGCSVLSWRKALIVRKEMEILTSDYGKEDCPASCPTVIS